MKKTKKRFALIPMMIVLCLLLVTTAFAGQHADMVWRQSLEKCTIDLGYLTPSSDINRADIRLHFVAISPADGRFKVVLQRQGLLGIWFNTDCGEGIGFQGSGHKYDSWFDDYVEGQPNTIYWVTNKAGNYRAILENPTAPQMTGLTRIVWKAV